MEELKEEVEEKKAKLNRKKQVKEAIWRGKGKAKTDAVEQIYQLIKHLV